VTELVFEFFTTPCRRFSHSFFAQHPSHSYLNHFEFPPGFRDPEGSTLEKIVRDFGRLSQSEAIFYAFEFAIHCQGFVNSPSFRHLSHDQQQQCKRQMQDIVKEGMLIGAVDCPNMAKGRKRNERHITEHARKIVDKQLLRDTWINPDEPPSSFVTRNRSA
jgi:hypothetical protein